MPIVLLLVLAAAGSFLLWAVSDLRKARTGVHQSWNEIESAMGERTKLVNDLVHAVSPKLTAEKAAQLTKAHERMGAVVGPRSVEAADNTLRALMGPILDSMPSSFGLDGLKASILAANGAIDAAASDYNTKVETYETSRSSSGKQLVASTLGFEKEHGFRVAATSPAVDLMMPALL
jgi:hypothetical protein